MFDDVYYVIHVDNEVEWTKHNTLWDTTYFGREGLCSLKRVLRSIRQETLYLLQQLSKVKQLLQQDYVVDSVKCFAEITIY